MLTQEKQLVQVNSAQTRSGIINPTRNITKEDELYLRDYTLASAVISWDEGTYGTSHQVIPGEITNIGICGDTVWYQVNFTRAIPIDIETFHAHRLQIQSDIKSKQEQLTGFAGDSIAYQLRPNQEPVNEFEQGFEHGQLDAAQRLHPIYSQATCQYSTGYLEGYKSTRKPQQQKKRPTWSVSYDYEFDWYKVWVDRVLVGKATTYEQAEQMAQKHIASNDFWQGHRERVLASYAG